MLLEEPGSVHGLNRALQHGLIASGKQEVDLSPTNGVRNSDMNNNHGSDLRDHFISLGTRRPGT